ncbi:MAG TPA: hypothetical protein VFW33_12015, partial [Gemmataceae bacterium]|nr:hypothetical protein [Gemmataceae bacterium]
PRSILTSVDKPHEVAELSAEQSQAFAAAFAGDADTAWSTERLQQTHLLRDVFGPLPFREVTVDIAWLTWNTGTVRKIAEGIYEERAFDRMAILHDALLDAGCDNEDMLAHCRSSAGPHVRGCWVIDLILGKG